MEHINVSNVERKVAMRLLAIFCLLLFNIQLSAQSLDFKHSNEGFNFWESLPKNYTPDQTYPLIVFLHGRGERGDGTNESANNILTWGPLRHIKHDRFKSFTFEDKKYSFIVIAPQLNKPTSLWEPGLVDEVINYAILNYPVDVSRIYLTGLSMGGNGTWVYAYSDYNTQNRLAAIVPIASWGNIDKACKIASRNIPVWAFHGTDDNVIAFDRGKAVFDAAHSCMKNNMPEMKFTAYEETKHDSWQKAYDIRNEYHTPNVYEWMLSHTLEDEQASKVKGIAEKRTLTPEIVSDQKNLSESSPLKIIAKLPSSLDENSGMTFDSNGNIWMINDSGNGPFIFKLDTIGNVIGFKKIIYATNFDWEDITIDDDDNLFIADIGNNENLRKKLMVYKINLNDTSSRLAATTISFSYEDQTAFPPSPDKMNFDAESIIYLRDSLYIFSKNRSEPFDGTVNVYQIPAREGEYSAKLIDQLKLGSDSMLDNWITAAALSNDNKHLVLLSHSKFWLISCFKNNKFSSGEIQEVPLNTFSQKESVSFYNDDAIYLSDENYRKLTGGNLYKMLLGDLLHDCNNY
ncbi:hypothetical protein [Fulvivirga sp.]|uniref:dienelactone hydrolase family protein n=1 Tax=Fulvivirga sp. TaxID=1931237 RepID=UPI0032ECEFC7